MLQIENYKETDKLDFCYFILRKKRMIFELETDYDGEIIFYSVCKEHVFRTDETVI